MTDVTIQRDALEVLLRAPHGPIGRYLLGLMLQVVDVARTLCPRGKGLDGHLADAIDADRRVVDIGTGLAVYGRAKKPYALAVHEGARPHPIDPVNRTFLRFEAGGEVIFTKHVDHPGNAGNPFLLNALRSVVR